MGLIKCTECNNKISDKADKCPKCGVSMKDIQESSLKKKKSYKSIWVGFLFLFIIIMIFGSSEEKNTSENVKIKKVEKKKISEKIKKPIKKKTAKKRVIKKIEKVVKKPKILKIEIQKRIKGLSQLYKLLENKYENHSKDKNPVTWGQFKKEFIKNLNILENNNKSICWGDIECSSFRMCYSSLNMMLLQAGKIIFLNKQNSDYDHFKNQFIEYFIEIGGNKSQLKQQTF